MTPTIFLDVDEVLAEWVSATLRLIGLDVDEAMARWDAQRPRPWDMFAALGLDAADAWGRIGEAGPDFWADLAVTPWAHELVGELEGLGDVVLLTAPSRCPSSYAGKAAWLARHFPDTPHLIGRCKHRCARWDAILVDDSPTNCGAFRRAGGGSVVFPGVGNDMHSMPAGERVDHAVSAVARWSDSLGAISVQAVRELAARWPELAPREAGRLIRWVRGWRDGWILSGSAHGSADALGEFLGLDAREILEAAMAGSLVE